MSDQAQNPLAPLLREDITLHPGPPEYDGSPTWTVYDPVSSRFFRLDWAGFEMLSRFRPGARLLDIVQSVNRETSLLIESEDVQQMFQFIKDTQLQRPNGDEDVQKFVEIKNKGKQSIWQHLLHKYLFFKIPLARPNRFLEETLPYVKPLMTRTFFLSMMLLLAIGIGLTVQRVDEFFNTFTDFVSLKGAFLFFISLAFLKILHEAGHAYQAAKYGVTVTSMGIALLFMYPILYTQTTGAWKLTDKHQRVMIAAGGILVELCIAAVALLLWHVLPDGPMRGIMFFLATISLVGSLVVNFNPLMRFDGYYLLCDSFGIENMERRGFAFAKWRLRRFLFGWPLPIPEFAPKKIETILTVWGFSTMVYRFFLFTGIAILVYVMFPKPLGPILAAIELYLFLIRPTMHEIKAWFSLKQPLRLNFAFSRTLFLLMIAAGLFFLPWRQSIEVPSVLKVGQSAKLHTVVPGEIAEIHVKSMQSVKKGDTLLTLNSPDLVQQRRVAEMELGKLRFQLAQAKRNRELIQEVRVLENRVRESMATLQSLRDQQSQLVLKAPFDGVIVDLRPNLHISLWVNETEPLIHMANFENAVLQGYVREDDLDRIKNDAPGVFYADSGLIKPLNIEITEVQPTASATLLFPELVNRYGGPIPIEESGGESLIPHHTEYAVNMVPESTVSFSVPQNQISGVVKLEGEQTSAAYEVFKYVAAAIIRESGF